MTDYELTFQVTLMAEEASIQGARFGAAAPLEYEVTGEIGHPHWDLIFEYVLRQRGYLVDFHTVYVMVDNRELANHKRQDPSLPHWPAAAISAALQAQPENKSGP